MSEKETDKLTEPAQYEVGYGKPPANTRFRKGQSGNPRGSRPKLLSQDSLDELIAQETHRPVTVIEGERRRKMSAFAAMLRRVYLHGMKGNVSAQRLFLDLVMSTDAKVRALHDEAVKEVIKYKVEVEGEIRRRKAAGVTDFSDIEGHPDDILIDLDANQVYFTKEVNSEDHRKLRKLGLKRK